MEYAQNITDMRRKLDFIPNGSNPSIHDKKLELEVLDTSSNIKGNYPLEPSVKQSGEVGAAVTSVQSLTHLVSSDFPQACSD